jgi:UDP-N-acetylmuramate: L-alanyl-gamma-D-glutamyl-meso-diaminopimelate ligase
MAKQAHFIGICGVGMSATAVLLKHLGWEVTGSDAACYPPASDYLARHEIPVNTTYTGHNIPEDVALIVIGKNAKLVSGENAEVAAAFETGASIRSFPEVLGGLADETNNVVVAGSYGKSTTTALLTWCLTYAGHDPSYFIGAQPYDLDETAHIGSGSTFVLEGDEYPAANWDETPKFHYYNPHSILLTSAEHDHINVYPTLEEYLIPFKVLVSLLPETGTLVACADEANAAAIAQTHPARTVTYGIYTDADWSACEIEHGECTTFILTYAGERVLSLETPLLGEHNVQNIVGVAALLLEQQLIDKETLTTAIATFNGLKRRLDNKAPHASVPVYEGFGSSYMKAVAAQRALKQRYPDRELVVVFEPYEFSWRNRQTAHWYDDAFTNADTVFIAPPASQGSESQEQLSQDEIVQRVAASGIDVRPITDPEADVHTIAGELSQQSVVLMMSSGTIGGLVEALPEKVQEVFRA